MYLDSIPPVIFSISDFGNPRHINFSHALSTDIPDFNNFAPLITAKLGIFSYHCDAQENCSYILVAKTGTDFTIIRHLSGSYGNISLFSPDSNYAIIPFHQMEKGDDSTVIERDALALIDLETMRYVIPNNALEYFEEPLYPIKSFKWLNSTSLEIETADITSYMHDDLYKWQTSATKPTKKVIVELQ